MKIVFIAVNRGDSVMLLMRATLALAILSSGMVSALTLPLTVTRTGFGTVSAATAGISCGTSCNAIVSSGANVTLTATPQAGSTFAGWSGDCAGSTSTCTVAMSAARRAHASFANFDRIETPAAWNYTISPPSRSACASYEGTTYDVGPGKPYLTPKDVPWLNLGACDQVLINYRVQPYNDIIMLGVRGEQNKYITIRGIPGPSGEMPVFDGNGAITPLNAAINPFIDGGGMILIYKPSFASPVAYGYKPGYIHITGLKIQNVRAPATYKSLAGTVQAWPDFTAGIDAIVAEQLAITNCEFADNSLGLFVNSQADEAQQSRNLWVANNYFHGNGMVNLASMHNAYSEAIGTIYEYNYFGPPVTGTGGDNIKERSAGIIFRYNYIEDGVNLISLRDPQSNQMFEAVALDYLGDYLVSNAFLYSNIFRLKNKTVYGDPSVLIGHGDGTFGNMIQTRYGDFYFYSNKVISSYDTTAFNGDSVALFDMINTFRPTTIQALNNQFYAQKKTPSGILAPIAIFYYQGVANWQSNWINRFRNTYASSADGSLAVGTPFNGTGLGGLTEQSSDPGFVDLANGDFRSTPTSPFLALNAPLPAAVTIRGLSPTANPVYALNSGPMLTVTPSVGSNGTISPSVTQLVNFGGISAFNVTPSPGFTIATAGGTCGGALNGTTFTTNAITASCTVNFTFSLVPLAFIGAQSRKTHAGVGDFDIAIAPTPLPTDPVTVEPRSIGTGHLIVFQFNKPIGIVGTVSAIDAVTSTTVTGVTSAAIANEVNVTLPAVNDNKRIRITIDGVDGVANPISASIGFLVGDVNNTRSANSSDISGVKARSGQTTTAANFKFDVNLSGAINSSDISAVKARSGLTLP